MMNTEHLFSSSASYTDVKVVTDIFFSRPLSVSLKFDFFMFKSQYLLKKDIECIF